MTYDCAMNYIYIIKYIYTHSKRDFYKKTKSVTFYDDCS